MAGMQHKEKGIFLKGIYHILSHVKYENGRGVYMFCNTGNAYGASAGPNTAKSLNGHCYGGLEVEFTHSPSKIFRTLLEGTKWVMPLSASFLKNPDVQTLRRCNEVAGLLMEATKHPSLDVSLDVGGTLLQIMQGMYAACDMSRQTHDLVMTFHCTCADKGQTFYASVYVSDNRLMFRESVPGILFFFCCFFCVFVLPIERLHKQEASHRRWHLASQWLSSHMESRPCDLSPCNTPWPHSTSVELGFPCCRNLTSRKRCTLLPQRRPCPRGPWQSGTAMFSMDTSLAAYFMRMPTCFRR